MPVLRGGVKPVDLLATIRAEIEARRDELRHAVAEYEQLLSAAAALEEEGPGAPPTPTPAPVTRNAPLVRRMRITSKASVVRKAPAVRRAAAPPKAKAPARKTIVPPAAPPAPKPAPAKAAARPEKAPAPARVSRSESQQAITAALEHGSHTVAELAIVTAMPGSAIREALRGLRKAGKVTKTKRGDGKAAYALAS
ncbi:MAG TPA: hypothetical protein VFY36_05505 [Solirubrobacteraceae bacterium]|nr:hypothetical protein [Solirubrobacteraceae bacterium]